MHPHTLVLAALAAAAAAASNATDVTCGSTKYTSEQVELAFAEGCRLYEAGQTVGQGSYPHRFNNREGLTFSADGPYEEFPLVKEGKFGSRAKRSLADKVKGGKSKGKNNNNPGADRVVFNPDLNGECVYVGAMTHTGAEERNGFVACEAAAAAAAAGDDEGAGAAVAPMWYLAASGMAAYWAMGM